MANAKVATGEVSAKKIRVAPQKKTIKLHKSYKRIIALQRNREQSEFSRQMWVKLAYDLNGELPAINFV